MAGRELETWSTGYDEAGLAADARPSVAGGRPTTQVAVALANEVIDDTLLSNSIHAALPRLYPRRHSGLRP